MKKILFLLAFLINALLVFSQAPIPLNRLSRSSDRFMMMMSDTNRYASYQHFNYWLSKFKDSLNLQNPYWLGTILPQQSVSIGAERHNFIISNGIIGSFATDTTANGWILQSYVSGLNADGVGKIGGRNYLTGKRYGIDFDGATPTILSGNVGLVLANHQVQDATLKTGFQYFGTSDSSGNLTYVRSDTVEFQPGLKWTTRTSAADNSWRAIAYGNGIFVATSFTGTGNRVMTSPDGINWTSRTSAANNEWYGVTYGNGLFVAVAQTGTGNRVMTSPDGINWTSRTSAADNEWYDVTYGNGLFVAVSVSGTGNRVMTSPDGINWTSRTSAADNEWTAVTYGNGLFVAVSRSGTGNRVMTSPDGINWTSRTSVDDLSWLGVVYGNGLFVAVALSGTNTIMTSPDGITWTARNQPTGTGFYSIAYGNGLFVAPSLFGQVAATSPDGINWTARPTPNTNSYRAIEYGNGIFVAVAQSGTGNRVMTSGVQDISTNPSNNIFQGDYKYPSYPNTRNDTSTVANFLYTDASGAVQSKSTASFFGSIWQQSATGVTNAAGTVSKTVNGFSTDANDSPANYTVFGDTLVQIKTQGNYTIIISGRVSTTSVTPTDTYDVTFSVGGSIVPPTYTATTPFSGGTTGSYVNRVYNIKTTSSNVSFLVKFNTVATASTATFDNVQLSIQRNY